MATAALRKATEVLARELETHLAQNPEPLQSIKESLAKLNELLCTSVQQDGVLDAICEVEDALAMAVAALSKGNKLSLELAKSVGQVLDLFDNHSQQLEQYQFLAEHRDFISRFRGHVVARVQQVIPRITSWEQLSWALQDEDLLPERDREITEAVLQALQGMGFTWVEWCLLRNVADSGVSLLHAGARTTGGMLGALQRLRTEPVPRGLEGSKQAMLKALEYNIGAAQRGHHNAPLRGQ